MSDVKLGLGSSPDPTFLFVGEIEEQGQVYPWYRYDHDKKAQVPVKDRALTGQITGLRMTLKTFKDKKNVKLDLMVKADNPYVIRSGVETTFARGILLALELIDDYETPLTVVVANGGEKVVFGRLHRASGERVKVEWDKGRKLFPLVNKIQQRLGQRAQSWEDVQATEKLTPYGGNGHHEEPPQEPDYLEDAPF